MKHPKEINSIFDDHFKTTFYEVTKTNNFPKNIYIQIPIAPPKNIIPFSKYKEVIKDLNDYYICFYCEDKEFEKVYKNPKHYEKIFNKAAGLIGFDFSVWTNLAVAEQNHRIYKNLTLTQYFSHRNIIPNIRYGVESTRDEFLETIPPMSLVAVGTHGFVKTVEQKRKWTEEMHYVIDKIKPRGVVVYGPHPKDVFRPLEETGTKFYYYDSWKPPLHRKGKKNGN